MPQRRMMAIANRRYSIQMAWAGLLLATAMTVLGAGRGGSRGVGRWIEARSLVSQLLVAEWDRLPEILASMHPDGGLWRDEVAGIASDPSRPADDRLRARLVLARHDPETAAGLIDDLSTSSPQRLRIIWDQMEPWKDGLCDAALGSARRPGLAVGAAAAVRLRAGPGRPVERALVRGGAAGGQRPARRGGPAVPHGLGRAARTGGRAALRAAGAGLPGPRPARGAAAGRRRDAGGLGARTTGPTGRGPPGRRRPSGHGPLPAGGAGPGWV